MNRKEQIEAVKVSPQLKTVVQTTILAALLFTVQNTIAQGRRSDYWCVLNRRGTTANEVFKDRIVPHWFAENACFWYRNDLSGQGSRPELSESIM